MLYLRTRHLLVEVYVFRSGEAADKLQQCLFRPVIKAYEAVGYRQRPGVYERIARPALLIFELNERIERVAGGFAAHELPHVLAKAAHHHGQREDFGNALYGEFRFPVACACHDAVGGGHGDAEL